MKYIKIIIALIILAVIAFGCSKTGFNVLEKSDSIENSEQQLNDTLEEASLDCNDNDECTEDIASNNECTHNIIKPCCGNNICEENEGCNTVNYATGCIADCGIKCEAKLSVSSPTCDGNCVIGTKGIHIGGFGKVKFTLTNLGEKPLEDLKAELDCKIIEGEMSYAYEGYFNDNKESLTLQPKDKGYYYMNFNRPDNFVLDCDLIFRSRSSVIFESITITST